jgi:cyanophycinase
VARFLKAAKGDEAKLLVVLVGEAKAEGILDLLKAKKAGWLEILKLDSAATAKTLFTTDALGLATGVWLFAAGDPAQTKEILGDAAIARELLGVRLRGGVVAASGAAAWLLPAHFLGAQGKAQAGLAVLPAMVVSREAKQESGVHPLDATLAQMPAMLGVSLGDGAALFVSGREMRALGKGPVSLSLARSPAREPRKVAMRPNGQVDYNEMRRAALGRAQQTPYPPKEAATPEVPKGTLIIVGGGGLGADIAKRFVELGGGAEGTFVVLPISNPDPLPANSGDGFLKRHGAKNILVLKAREQKELEDPKNIEVLKKASAVWFGGGRQWRFVDAYEGTKIHELFRGVLRRGGVIGGSSAGATIQGDYLCRGAPGGPNNIICEGYERALGFLPGVAIDQHFTQRNRFKDMVLLMKTYPQFLGIGLDEATAIVVQGHVAEIMGPNQVHFYDRRKPVVEGQPDHESLKAGARYDLKERKLLGAKETKDTK